MALTRALAALPAALFALGLAVSAAAQTGGDGAAEAEANRPDPADVFDARERAALQAAIEQYLLDNPEILEEMVAKLKAREEGRASAQGGDSGGAEAVAANREALLDKAGDPVGGNPDGDVTIVEFFDYNCGYCRQLAPRLADLVKTDGNIRVVYKEFPILAESSATAARAALAVQDRAPAKYEAFHRELMQNSAEPTPERLAELAEEHGLDGAAIKDAATSGTFDARLQANIDLARALGISGTPAMVIGDQVITGAVPRERIAQAVQTARAD